MFNTLTDANAQFATVDFDPALKDWSFVEPLIIGAGGIGCELLHLLALSGFAHLTVIDMDYVELSNLNRQFLFTEADIGRPKSVVAAEAVMARSPNVSVTAVVGRLEDQSDSFYEKHDVLLLAVDSISARRWINRKVAQLAVRTIVPSSLSAAPTETPVSSSRHSAASASECAPSSPSNRASSTVNPVRSVGLYVVDEAKPIIDTGTEGFEGHCRIINMQHNRTPCIECEMYLYNDGATRKTVPLCTLESVPRSPEHCVLYVQMKEWPDERGNAGTRISNDNNTHHIQDSHSHSDESSQNGVSDAGVLNPDNPEHVRWIAQRARARQEMFGISGAPIDEIFTLGVIKNVVPAVGFTNAYVAGQAVTETLKWLTGCAPGLNNFAFYNGATEGGVFTDVQRCCGAPVAGSGDVNRRCLVCGPRPVVQVDAASVSPSAFVEGLINLSTTDAAARRELRCGTASLVFQSGSCAAGVVEVALPRLDHRQHHDSVDTSRGNNGDDGSTAQPAATNTPNAVDDASSEVSLADFLLEAGHDVFVRQWKSGLQMATAEFFGSSEARIYALVQWGA